MPGDMNAVGILIAPPIAVLMIFLFGQLPTDPVRILKRLLVTLLIGIGLMFNSVHLCGAGRPFNQWFIPMVCAAFVATFIQRKDVRWWTAGCFIAYAFLLSRHYLDLVHGDAYTGNPAWERGVHAGHANAKLRSLRYSLSELAKTNTTSYPESWLSESEIRSLIPQRDADDLSGKSPLVFRSRHTPLTGLYPKAYRKTEVWYPGGTLKDSLDELEFRQR